MRYSQGLQAEIDPGTGAVELFPFEVIGTPKHIVVVCPKNSGQSEGNLKYAYKPNIIVED